MVRAKFRCTGINHKLGMTIVMLKPVIAKDENWTEGSEENAHFWNASPSGEMDVNYGEGAELPYTLRGYYYIDLEESDDEADWKLWKVSQTETSLEVQFGLEWVSVENMRADKCKSASFRMDIHNEAAWPPFLGKQGTRWKLTVTEAEGHHPGCPYTGS